MSKYKSGVKLALISLFLSVFGIVSAQDTPFSTDTLDQIKEGTICVPFELHLNLEDYNDKSSLDSIRIRVTNLYDNSYDEFYINNGILTYTLFAGANYEFIAYKKGYFTKRFRFENCLEKDGKENAIFCAYGVLLFNDSEAQLESNTHLEGLVKMEKIKINKTFTFKNIYYDLDKYYIRPDAAKELNKLVKIAVDNPTLTFELGSHCDSRGSDEYNMVLSQNRAESAVAYLVKSGVEANRLTAQGYGESKLVNECENGVICSSAKHQENRRTEFKVIGIEAVIKNEIKELEDSRIIKKQ